jgi:hypothetical protein
MEWHDVKGVTPGLAKHSKILVFMPKNLNQYAIIDPDLLEAWVYAGATQWAWVVPPKERRRTTNSRKGF